jgi:small nuclear ribonucleoprotein (snRNP)-like protein
MLAYLLLSLNLPHTHSFSAPQPPRILPPLQTTNEAKENNNSNWVSNFKYLLPSSFRSSHSVDVSNFHPSNADPIFLQASTFHKEEEECDVEEEGVIDVECLVVEEDKKNGTRIEERSDAIIANDTVKRGWFRRILHRDSLPDETVTNSTDVIDATEEQSSIPSNENDTTTSRQNKPIFHNLETNDIDTSTLRRQRKWSRRRKRAVLMVRTVKNAVVLFLLTFLAGNVMNQFVDLDEDGSFEVHFGKGLGGSVSTARDASSALLKREKATAVEPSMGLVARAVQKVGPAVVRVETETDNNNHAADEERGDIYDGIPEVPNVDLGQGSGIVLLISDEFHVLTNSHVVDGASRIRVRLTDGRRLDAELVGSDDIVDVALLRIVVEEEMELPVADLGDSDRLVVGTFVSEGSLLV